MYGSVTRAELLYLGCRREDLPMQDGHRSACVVGKTPLARGTVGTGAAQLVGKTSVTALPETGITLAGTIQARCVDRAVGGVKAQDRLVITGAVAQAGPAARAVRVRAAQSRVHACIIAGLEAFEALAGGVHARGVGRAVGGVEAFRLYARPEEIYEPGHTAARAVYAKGIVGAFRVVQAYVIG